MFTWTEIALEPKWLRKLLSVPIGLIGGHLRQHSAETLNLDCVVDGMKVMTRETVVFHLRQSFMRCRSPAENDDPASDAEHSTRKCACGP